MMHSVLAPQSYTCSNMQGWGGSVPRTASATVLPPTRKGSGLPVEGPRSAAPALAAWRARRGIALDITALPGMALLSAKVSFALPSSNVELGHMSAIGFCISSR